MEEPQEVADQPADGETLTTPAVDQAPEIPDQQKSYEYSPLPNPQHTRMLRLLPEKDPTAPIRCQLFEYPLLNSSECTHLYEALSYAWGSSDKPKCIFVDGGSLAVTQSIHEALLRLRNHSFERVLWIDAVCINQDDNNERSAQVQFMAKVYYKASRVIVWLGEEADRSDQALDEIRTAAIGYGHGPDQAPISALLSRPWFQRMWVLQEVAAARQIVIMCGSAEIDGPKRAPIWEGKDFLGIRPMGELVDMYHTHKATEPLDKIFALLGMGNDDPIAAGLLPDYNSPWAKIFLQLINFLFGNDISVETLASKEAAVINGKGVFIGKISEVYTYANNSHEKLATVKMKDTDREILLEGVQWALHDSTSPVQSGDLVCWLDGASKPMVIRPCLDFFFIIMSVVSPPEGTVARGEKHNFLLAWDWGVLPETSENHQYADWKRGHISECLRENSDDQLGHLARLKDVALILKDAEEYATAAKQLQLVTKGLENEVGKLDERTATSIEDLAILYKDSKDWRSARVLLQQAILGMPKVTPGMMSMMTTLRLICQDEEGGVSEAAKWESMKSLLAASETETAREEALPAFEFGNGEEILFLLEMSERRVSITEEMISAVARNEFGVGVMKALLEKRTEEVVITEKVVLAAAGASRATGLEVMKLLFDQRGDEIPITEAVFTKAAGNPVFGLEAMQLLLTQGGNKIPITRATVLAATGNSNFGPSMVKLLFDQRGDEVPVPEAAVIEAAKNDRPGHEIMKVLLAERGTKVSVTETVLVQAAKNHYFGRDTMELLVNLGEARAKITEAVVIAAAGNTVFGHDILMLLIHQRGYTFPVTETVLIVAAGNHSFGLEIIRLLLHPRAPRVPITEAMVLAAAGNSGFRQEIMQLMLSQ